MKKLALVIALAAAASWLLAERRAHVVPPPGRPRPAPYATTAHVPLVRGQEGPSARGPIRTISRVGSASRPRRPSPRDLPAPIPTAPSWFPASDKDEEAAARPDPFGVRVLVGRLSASEDRARRDLDEKVLREVRDWLAADVPPSWTPPARAIEAMGKDSYVQPIAKVFRPIPGEPAPEAGATPIDPAADGLDDVYTLYRAGRRYDFSPDRKADLIEMYRREVVDGRLQKFAAGVILALIALAVLVAYIRADEASKGFYTNRLRLVAAAALGASGVVIYRLVALS